jgi:hypothetical protein
VATQDASEHQHEDWQVRDDGDGRYCAACGKRLDPSPMPEKSPELWDETPGDSFTDKFAVRLRWHAERHVHGRTPWVAFGDAVTIAHRLLWSMPSKRRVEAERQRMDAKRRALQQKAAQLKGENKRLRKVPDGLTRLMDEHEAAGQQSLPIATLRLDLRRWLGTKYDTGPARPAVTPETIDDLVEAWHSEPENGVPLHEHLDMTWDQYNRWLRTGELPEPPGARVDASR